MKSGHMSLTYAGVAFKRYHEDENPYFMQDPSRTPKGRAFLLNRVMSGYGIGGSLINTIFSEDILEKYALPGLNYKITKKEKRKKALNEKLAKLLDNIWLETMLLLKASQYATHYALSVEQDMLEKIEQITNKSSDPRAFRPFKTFIDRMRTVKNQLSKQNEILQSDSVTDQSVRRSVADNIDKAHTETRDIQEKFYAFLPHAKKIKQRLQTIRNSIFNAGKRFIDMIHDTLQTHSYRPEPILDITPAIDWLHISNTASDMSGSEDLQYMHMPSVSPEEQKDEQQDQTWTVIEEKNATPYMQ